MIYLKLYTAFFQIFSLSFLFSFYFLNLISLRTNYIIINDYLIWTLKLRKPKQFLKLSFFKSFSMFALKNITTSPTGAAIMQSLKSCLIHSFPPCKILASVAYRGGGEGVLPPQLTLSGLVLFWYHKDWGGVVSTSFFINPISKPITN